MAKHTETSKHTEAKPGNWCSTANPNEPGCCGTDRISEDGKRHHCDRPKDHQDDLHHCKCGTQWKHMM